MKYAIMSDVHANPQALETALADARAQGCERFVMLGDTTGYGYDAKAALALVKKNFQVVLRGNHDAVCCGQDRSPDAEMNTNYDVDRQQQASLGKTALKWLGTRPYVKVEGPLAFTHGMFLNPEQWGYTMDPQDAAINLEVQKGDLLFCGHTHHAEIWEATRDKQLRRPSDAWGHVTPTEPESRVLLRTPGSRYVVNVGSVGYPRFDLCSTYAICDPAGDSLTLRYLPFDFKHYIEQLIAHKMDFPFWLSRLLQILTESAK